MKIVVTPRGFAKCGLENAQVMRAAGFDVDYNATGLAYTKEDFYRVTEDADGVIVGVETVDRAYIDAHPKLKAVVKFGVGTDNIDLEHCKQKGIFVGRTVGSNARTVAETAISFVIADSKNLFDSISNTRNHGWNKMTGYEIQGRTIGIIGFGLAGKHYAELLRPFAVDVIAYDPGVSAEAMAEIGVRKATLEEVFAQSDVLSLHAPELPSTRHIVNRETLASMKDGAILINTARGSLVDEEALVEALESGKLRYAAIDVVSQEPMKSDNPLLKTRKCIITPHIAWAPVESRQRLMDCVEENIRAYLMGQPQNVVNM